MSAAILDALTLSAAGFPSNFPVSAGSGRVALISLNGIHGTNAISPDSVTLGGQSMTLVAEAADIVERDSFTQVWGLDEAGIAAMSGDAIVVTGGTFTASKGFTVSLSGTSLASIVVATYLAYTASNTAITQALDRQANSVTLAFLTIDDSATVNSSSGPTLSILDNATSPSVGAGSQAEASTVTADFTWNQSLSRDSALVLINAREVAAAPTITDIDGDESVYPGQSYIIQATDDIGATAGTVFWERLDGTDSVQHTVTGWDAATDQVTVTAVRGTHNYGAGLYRARVVLADATEILFDNAGAGLTLEAEPDTFAVTAASPNTADDASLWSGLVDTGTSNPVTVVDGDQAWVKDPNSLGNLAVTPAGEISADDEGDFVVQFWRASEEVWGSDQTVSFALPEEPNPPGIGRNLKKTLKSTLKQSLRSKL